MLSWHNGIHMLNAHVINNVPGNMTRQNGFFTITCCNFMLVFQLLLVSNLTCFLFITFIHCCSPTPKSFSLAHYRSINRESFPRGTDDDTGYCVQQRVTSTELWWKSWQNKKKKEKKETQLKGNSQSVTRLQSLHNKAALMSLSHECKTSGVPPWSGKPLLCLLPKCDAQKTQDLINRRMENTGHQDTTTV